MGDVVNVLRAPVFNGEADEWPFFKAKLKAYLAKCKLTKLVTWKGVIRKDGHVWADSYDATKKAEEVLIQEQNIQAVGILLQAIDTSTAAGKAAFYQVEKFMDADAGYAGGHFLKAWEELCKRYDEKEVVELVDIQQEYFDMKMEGNERPSEFIVRMERMRKKLKDNGYDIKNEDFLKQVLAKLPKGKEDELGPYQVEKRAIELEMKVDAGYNLTKLSNSLEKVYKTLAKDEAMENEEKEEDDKAYMAFSKSFKGRCNRCGKYGHKGRDCKEEMDKPSYSGRCFFCDKKGHKIQNCFAFKKYKEERSNEQDNDQVYRAMDGEVAL